ncbi:MAG: hypothetical protein E6J91_46075 [Deltaproteobacteria bacterium]|nr:MAG: hypothetical protein E6J91_46075 [Deltaproteobacteria bacterium]
MELLARWVLGYHGCTAALATEIMSGERPINAWPPSRNPYDWLGSGIYFWEHDPGRAMKWAQQRYGSSAAIVGAIIQLGRCFDLLDVDFTSKLLPAYEQEKQEADVAGRRLPTNRGRDDDVGGRYLDCRVINACLQALPSFQVVRGAFREGEPAFPSGQIFRESHIQIAVRDPRCILGVFRPT